MSWAALLQSAGSKAAMQGGKKLTANITKETLKAKAKDFVVDKAKDKIKSKFSKKKVKGKDIANKMFGGGDGGSSGGALVVRPSSSIVSSPAGGLIPFSKEDGGGSLVVGNDSKELGLTPFMESVIGVKESVESIKESLNDNLKDTEKRLEKQRLLNAKFRKQEREEELETKKPKLGLGKRIMKPAEDAAGNFLSKILRFLKSTLLGMFINALAGGARDVVAIFLLGYRQYRLAKDAVIKFVLKLRGNIGKGISNAGEGLSKAGSSIKNFLLKVRNVLVTWIKNAVKGVREAIRLAGKVGGEVVEQGSRALNWARKTNIGKGIERSIRSAIKNPLQTLSKGKQAVQNFIRNPGKTLQGGLQAFQKTQAGKFTTNLIKNPGKTLQGGLQGFQQGASNMFGGIKNWGVKQLQGALEFGGRQWGKLKNWGSKQIASMGKMADDLISGAGAKITKWRKNIEMMMELATNPGKLFEKAKVFLDGKMKDVVKNNKTWQKLSKLKDLKPQQIAGKIGGILKSLKKSKEVMGVVKTLKQAKQTMKLPMLDRILALILGLIDYTILGESPINATLKALGGLLGFSFGTALGAPLGPGAFVTGVAGGIVGEQLGNVISAGIAEIGGDQIPDPIAAATPGMSPRPLARNPFGKGAEEFDKQQQELSLANFEGGKSGVSDDVDKIEESASYEGEGVDETVIIDGSETVAASPVSQAGKVKFIPLGLSKETIVNSQYEKDFNAALYKV